MNYQLCEDFEAFLDLSAKQATIFEIESILVKTLWNVPQTLLKRYESVLVECDNSFSKLDLKALESVLRDIKTVTEGF